MFARQNERKLAETNLFDIANNSVVYIRVPIVVVFGLALRDSDFVNKPVHYDVYTSK